jgi:hypothetical protein
MTGRPRKRIKVNKGNSPDALRRQPSQVAVMLSRGGGKGASSAEQVIMPVQGASNKKQ